MCASGSPLQFNRQRFPPSAVERIGVRPPLSFIPNLQCPPAAPIFPSGRFQMRQTSAVALPTVYRLGSNPFGSSAVGSRAALPELLSRREFCSRSPAALAPAPQPNATILLRSRELPLPRAAEYRGDCPDGSATTRPVLGPCPP